MILSFINITSFTAYAGIMFGISVFLFFHIFINHQVKLNDYISFGVLLLFIILAFTKMIVESKALRYVLIIILFLYFIWVVLFTIYDIIVYKLRRDKVHEQIKNDTYDMYMALDEFGNVIEYSNSLSDLTRLTKQEIIGKKGWMILFDNLNIETINGQQFISSNASYFLNHIDEEASKLKMYSFDMVIRIYGEKESTHYVGLFQTMYFKSKKIGSAIYLYKDRKKALLDVKEKLSESLNMLYKNKNVLKILMSLSEGIALYYDYQEKLYYATEAFKNYVGNNVEAYTFQQFYDFIDDEDKELYAEQSKTINSISVTRIKFKMKIKNISYNAIEDSLYLTKDGLELVSIIHITSRSDTITQNDVLSTKEAVELLHDLAKNPVSDVADKYERVLNTVTKDEESE